MHAADLAKEFEAASSSPDAMTASVSSPLPGKPRRKTTKRNTGTRMQSPSKDAKSEECSGDAVAKAPSRGLAGWKVAKRVLLVTRTTAMVSCGVKLAAEKRRAERMAERQAFFERTGSLDQQVSFRGECFGSMRTAVTAYKSSAAKSRNLCDPWQGRNAVSAVGAKEQPSAVSRTKLGMASTSPNARFLMLHGLRLGSPPPPPRSLSSTRCRDNMHLEIQGEVEQAIASVLPRDVRPHRVVCAFDTFTGQVLHNVMVEFKTAQVAQVALAACQRRCVAHSGSAPRGHCSWQRCGLLDAPLMGAAEQSAEDSGAPGLEMPGEVGVNDLPRRIVVSAMR